MCLDDFWRSAKEKSQPSRQRCGSSELGPKAPRPLPSSLCDEWAAGSQDEPLARIEVDEHFYFGMMGCRVVREAASRFFPKHTAAAAWTHRNLSLVEQEGLAPMPKDRGAEQGDVDGPLEEMVAAEMQRRIAARQAAGSLPWIGVDDPSELQHPEGRKSANFQLGGLEKLTNAHDPRHALEKNGGLAHVWCVDDGDIMCHPILVLFFCRISISPTPKSERSGTHRRQESSTT